MSRTRYSESVEEVVFGSLPVGISTQARKAAHLPVIFRPPLRNYKSDEGAIGLTLREREIEHGKELNEFTPDLLRAG